MAKEGLSILGFMHVCMINKWESIFREQLSIIKESGLYDEVKTIYIGCLGKKEELTKLNSIIDNDEKLRLGAYMEDIGSYEFLTLEVIKRKADISGKFFGFYVHTKGVSWPDHPGGKYWRDYMNHYNLKLWKDNVINLCIGYDTSGVKIVNKNFPLHYSGNFFWFNSEYVKTLPTLNKLDRTDRFKAEMWIGMAQPICATLCQDFVDYNTKGTFKP